MSIQSQLNNEAINMLPKIKKLIAESEHADILFQSTLQKCMNSRVAISDMNGEELNRFQDNVIGCFIHNDWI